VLADLNRDGLVDAAVSTTGPGGIGVLINQGAGNLVLTDTLPTAALTSGLMAADFDNDGAIDLAVAMSDPATPDTSALALFISRLHPVPGSR
jgi:hypothetical protein